MLFFESVQVGAVRTVDEIQWYYCYRQNFHTDAGPDEVARTALENAFRPRSIDRLSREERHDDLRRSALYEAIHDDSNRDRHSLPRPHEVAHRATERPVR